MKVGSEHEQKEQIFRNFAGSLGPNSDPTLSYSVHTDESFNISISWIDPENVIRSISTVSVSNGDTANFVKPTLKHPLTPGNWTATINTLDHNVIYRVGFTILPLEVYQGNIISHSERRCENVNLF